MNPDVFFEVVLELECFPTFRTLELAQVGALVMGDHVTLEAVDVSERFVTHLAHLGGG